MDDERRDQVTTTDACWFVQASRMLHDLDEPTLAAVASGARMATYAPGSLLQTAGEPMVVTFVRRGRVKVYRVSVDGRQQTLTVLGPSDAFGEIGVVDPGPQDLYAEALDEVEVCRISRERFLDLVARDPALAVRLAEAVAAKLAEARERLADLAFRDVRGRVAHLLLTFLEREQRSRGQQDLRRFAPGLTHREIADIVGTRRESVTLSLNALEREGVIAVTDRVIEVLDPDGLRIIADA